MRHFYDLDILEGQIFGELAPEEDGESPGHGGEAERAEKESSGHGGEAEMAEEEPPADLMLTLTLEDGSEVCCRAAGIFMEDGKEYIALETGGDELQIMALVQGEDDGISLLPIEDDAEREAAFQAFLEIVGTETERGEDYDGDQDREEN